METREDAEERMQVELTDGEMDYGAAQLNSLTRLVESEPGHHLLSAQDARKRMAETFALKQKNKEEIRRTKDEITRTKDEAVGSAMVAWIGAAFVSLVETGTLDAVKDRPFPNTGRGLYGNYFTTMGVIRAADYRPQGIHIQLNEVDRKVFVDFAQPVLQNSGYDCISGKGHDGTYRNINIRFEAAETVPPPPPPEKSCVCQ